MTQEVTVPAPVEDLHPAERACIDRAVLRRRLDFHDVSIRVSPEDGEFGPTAPVCTACADVMFSRGLGVLRFDFSGIGDSGSRTDNLPFEASTVLETKQAMDYLEAARNVHTLVLAGICSGADVAVRTASSLPCGRRW